MEIRLAHKSDLSRIVDIYNQSIPSMCSTGDLQPLDKNEQIPWFEEHIPTVCPIYVAEMNRLVVGYNSLSLYRGGRGAFRYVRETSFYVDNQFKKKGVASQLMEFVLRQCEILQVKTLITFVMAHNKPSIHLLKKYGFERWALLPNIADFNGKEFNHTIYGKRLINS
ncbi:MAG TPA: N-acetyltransferase family protein [Thioploca sp.]|nr:MAG: hypothetical protein B6247_21225 [Beggiatoa sp. 4572_84]RKZ55131.1 MAG: N-acetyltransferase [Gammaproteobacteria bacterium]HDN27589.1 N-acetyltransferase family protein [Thioploca sp.]